MARVDVGQCERHDGLGQPFRFPRRKAGTRFAASGEEAVAIPRHIDHEGRRTGLAVVFLARRDHAVSGRRHPVRHTGALAQDRRDLVEVRGERLGGIEDAEPALGSGKLLHQAVGDGAPVTAKADRGRKRSIRATFGVARIRIGGWQRHTCVVLLEEFGCGRLPGTVPAAEVPIKAGARRASIVRTVALRADSPCDSTRFQGGIPGGFRENPCSISIPSDYRPDRADGDGAGAHP